MYFVFTSSLYGVITVQVKQKIHAPLHIISLIFIHQFFFQQDEWNSFLGEVEHKENEHKEKQCSTLVAVGDVILSNFFLQRVTSPLHPAMTSDDGASNTETLEHIVKSSSKRATLFVLNRHFA